MVNIFSLGKSSIHGRFLASESLQIAHVAGTLWSTDIAMNKSSKNGPFCIDMLNFQRLAKETVEFPTKTLDFEPENEDVRRDLNQQISGTRIN